MRAAARPPRLTFFTSGARGRQQYFVRDLGAAPSRRGWGRSRVRVAEAQMGSAWSCPCIYVYTYAYIETDIYIYLFFLPRAYDFQKVLKLGSAGPGPDGALA